MRLFTFYKLLCSRGEPYAPRDGSVPVETIPLDDVVDELRGKLNNFNYLTEAKRRVAALMGNTALR